MGVLESKSQLLLTHNKSINAPTTVNWVQIGLILQKSSKYQTLSSILFFLNKSSGSKLHHFEIRWIQSRRSLKIFANFHKDQILLLTTQSTPPQTTFTKRKLTSHKIWGKYLKWNWKNWWLDVSGSYSGLWQGRLQTQGHLESNAIQTRSRPGVNP